MPVETGGVMPETAGWFVLNAKDSRWLDGTFGAYCAWEGKDEARFTQLGINVNVLHPGVPMAMYHRESTQEDFLVLAGECLLLVEGEERPLRQWDFFHSPPGVEHIFVGQGDTPCVLLMVGTRPGRKTLHYPRDETALRHGAGVEESTPSPHEAYAPHPHWRPGRPETWNDLPWVRSPG